MLRAFADPHAIACLSWRGSRLKRVPQASRPVFPRSGTPVTDQVTTTPGNASQSATCPDSATPPNCGNPTPCDAVRRNRQAWHARGQGFESPKLHQVWGLSGSVQDHPGASRELSSKSWVAMHPARGVAGVTKDRSIRTRPGVGGTPPCPSAMARTARHGGGTRSPVRPSRGRPEAKPAPGRTGLRRAARARLHGPARSRRLAGGGPRRPVSQDRHAQPPRPQADHRRHRWHRAAKADRTRRAPRSSIRRRDSPAGRARR
jgi:hypothetical protein